MSDTDKVIHFYNRFHVGDNLLNLKFFLYISDVLKANDIKIYYYYEPAWRFNKMSTLLSYTDTSVVTLKPLSEMPSTAIELWMDIPIHGVTNRQYEYYFELFYKRILSYIKIDSSSLATTLWLEEPFLLDVYDALQPQYKDIDILILNTLGHSGQFDNNSQLNNLAKYLSNWFTIVTVDPVNGITSAANLSLQQIGAISTRSKYIISTCSGPQVPCHNKYTKEYVKRWFFITSGVNLKYYSIEYQHTVMDVLPIKNFFDTLIASR